MTSLVTRLTNITIKKWISDFKVKNPGLKSNNLKVYDALTTKY
jgi:hypothetical protein